MLPFLKGKLRQECPASFYFQTLRISVIYTHHDDMPSSQVFPLSPDGGEGVLVAQAKACGYIFPFQPVAA